jgi:hypothetical protein
MSHLGRMVTKKIAPGDLGANVAGLARRRGRKKVGYLQHKVTYSGSPVRGLCLFFGVGHSHGLSPLRDIGIQFPEMPHRVLASELQRLPPRSHIRTPDKGTPMAFSSLSFALPWVSMSSFKRHWRAVPSFAYSKVAAFARGIGNSYIPHHGTMSSVLRNLMKIYWHGLAARPDVMREIEHCERAVQFYGCGVVGFCRILLRGECAQIIFFPGVPNLAGPAIGLPLLDRPLELPALLNPGITRVFAASAKAKIGLPVIETVMVDVVHFHAIRGAHDHAVHKRVFARRGVGTGPGVIGVLAGADAPTEGREILEILVVNESDVAARKFYFLRHWSAFLTSCGRSALSSPFVATSHLIWYSMGISLLLFFSLDMSCGLMPIALAAAAQLS